MRIKKIKIEHFLAFLWILAIVPKEVVLIISLISLIFQSKKILSFKKDGTYWLIMSIGLCQICAILMSMFYISTSTTRIIAALNTASIWIISAQMYLLFKNEKVNMDLIEKCSLLNLNIMFFLSIVAYILYKLNIPINNLYAISWRSYGYTFRLGCFLEFANLVGEFTLLMLPLASLRLLKKKKNFLILIQYLLALFVIYYSGSRICLVGYLIYVALTIYYFCRKCWKVDFAFLVFFVGIILILVILNYNKINNILVDSFHSREGSNSMRFAIYFESIHTLFQYNPVFGIGTKILYMGYPLGSHSTYVGILYKTGIVGTLLFLILIVSILDKYNKTKFKLVLFAVLSLLVCYIFEDLDATNWVGMAFFSLIGISLNHNFSEPLIADSKLINKKMNWRLTHDFN